MTSFASRLTRMCIRQPHSWVIYGGDRGASCNGCPTGRCRVVFRVSTERPSVRIEASNRAGRLHRCRALAVVAWCIGFAILAGTGCSGVERSAPAVPTDMKPVPGATFRMGTDSAELSSLVASTGLASASPLGAEVPAHDVSIPAFLMDTVDVTNAAFAEFVAAHPEWSQLQADSSLHNGRYLEHWIDRAPPAELRTHPTTFITWHAAVAYCAWRGKRLPTEAEYEWAAQDPARPGEYPWGNAAPHDTLVNWGGSGREATVAVGSYPPNGRGLYDMAGNVWRFTSDPWLGSYAEAGSAPRAAGWDTLTVRRVVRGGSWGANAANLRVRYRDSHRPFDAREMVGFRCARSIEPAP